MYFEGLVVRNQIKKMIGIVDLKGSGGKAADTGKQDKGCAC